MSYGVTVARSAERELNDLPPGIRSRIASALLRLATEPRPRGARKLVHGPGWRLRVGDYRILYTVNDDARLVTILAVGHRREVYRG